MLGAGNAGVPPDWADDDIAKKSVFDDVDCVVLAEDAAKKSNEPEEEAVAAAAAGCDVFELKASNNGAGCWFCAGGGCAYMPKASTPNFI